MQVIPEVAAGAPPGVPGLSLFIVPTAVPATATDDFYEGKRLAARYFVTHELPRIGPLLDLLDSGDTLLADLDDAWLG